MGLLSRAESRSACNGSTSACPTRGKIVTVEVEDERLRILDEHDAMPCVVPRTTTEVVTRFKAFGHRAGQA